MIEENYYDNSDLACICENLFYGSTNFAGNVGIKNLAEVCSMSQEKFDVIYPASEERIEAESMGLTQ